MARRNIENATLSMANNPPNLELLEKGVGIDDVDFIANYLDATGIPRGNIRELRSAVRRALDMAGVPYESWVKVGARGAVADFLIGGVAIRCEDAGQIDGIIGRVIRIAESRRIEGVILITSRNIEVPPEIFGKPLNTVRPT